MVAVNEQLVKGVEQNGVSGCQSMIITFLTCSSRLNQQPTNSGGLDFLEDSRLDQKVQVRIQDEF